MDYTNLAYVFSAVLFILGIKRLSSPKTARNGNAIASTGMLVAIIATLISFDLLDYKLIIIGMGIGGFIGILFATRVEMTQMPQMVAIFRNVNIIRNFSSNFTPILMKFYRNLFFAAC